MNSKLSFRLLHIALWVIASVGLLFLVNNYGAFHEQDGSVSFSIIIGTLFSILLFYLNSHYLMPKWFSHGRHTKYWSLLILYVASQTMGEALLDYFYLVNFYSTYNEPFISFILYNLFVNIIIALLSFTYRFIIDWRKNEREKQQLLEDKLKSEVAFLKSRINPHFLFNVLNSLYASSLSYKVPVLTQRLEEVAEMMRYMVYDTESEQIDIASETSFIERFISVSKMRLPEQLRDKIQFKIQNEEPSAMVAPLMFLPLLENAFKHTSISDPKFFITIKLVVKFDSVSFETKNSLGKDEYDKPSGFGLDNLKKRLAYSYPGKYQLNTSEQEGSYQVKLVLFTHD